MTGNKKYKTRSEKLAARRRRRERRLEKIGAGGKYLANTKLAKPGSERQLLKQIFKTIKGASLTDKESRDLTTAIEKHLIDAEKADPTLRPKRFGVKTWAELAELSVRKFEQMETKARTFREFSANKFVRGSQGGVRGWLFHLFVGNFEPLQNDLSSMAASQVMELNQLAQNPTKSVYLINALGEKVAQPVAFRKPLKAKRIDILKEDGSPVQSVDDARLSKSGKQENKKALWSFLVEMEAKTVGASGAFGEQIGYAQPRFHGAEKGGNIHTVTKIRIRITLDDGSPPFEISPQQLVVHPGLINRVAVTNASSKDWTKIMEVLVEKKVDIASHLSNPKEIYALSRFRFSETEQGYGETYLRVTLSIRTAYINKVTQAILPLLKKSFTK